ncbi:phosphoribosylglycinamide formyltransferase [Candidatus Binatia bacterium]|nr:phosphoribosylglycinamide formyltransferase [Candidatus Binatia bacterium]
MELAILISGRGSNLGAILRAVRDRQLDARIRLVLSNRPAAAGLDVAREAGVPTTVLEHGSYPDREAYDAALVAQLRTHGVDSVALAGFDRLVTGIFLRAFPGRVVNIHPALLPSFKGLHAQRQALEYGARIAGVTVHFVDEQMDHGPIIAQAVVPVLDDDTEQTLSERLLAEEHRIYPLALQRLARGELRVVGRRVIGGVP